MFNPNLSFDISTLQICEIQVMSLLIKIQTLVKRLLPGVG